MRIAIRVFQRLLYALYRQRLALLLLLVLGVGTGGYFVWRGGAVNEALAASGAPVEVTISDFQPKGNGATLTLKEKNGSRRIAMDLGGVEALAIARDRGFRTSVDPPQTYDLMRDVVKEMGGHIDRVVVNDASQSQYFAEVVVSNGGDSHVVRAKPADALALALRAGAPIFVENRVLDQFGTKGSG